MGTIKIPAADVLKKIYGETEESSARYTNLAVNFEKKYHHDKAEFFTAPGRTEIIGNHVDHNGGQIIAASIDLDTIGLKGSPTNVYKSFSPPQKGACMMLEGADKATCEKLVSLLAEKHII